jgi:hypothetical protein
LAFAGREGRKGMIGVDLIGEIRRAYFDDQGDRARPLLVSRGTVRKIVRGHKTEHKYEPEVQPVTGLVNGSRF